MRGWRHNHQGQCDLLCRYNASLAAWLSRSIATADDDRFSCAEQQLDPCRLWWAGAGSSAAAVTITITAVTAVTAATPVEHRRAQWRCAILCSVGPSISVQQDKWRNQRRERHGKGSSGRCVLGQRWLRWITSHDQHRRWPGVYAISKRRV